MFLSKGKLFKKRSQNSIIVQKQWSRYALKDKKAHIWLSAKGIGYTPKDLDELTLISQLCEDGLMAKTDKPNIHGVYDILTSNCICVNTQKSRLFSLRGLEKTIMLWLQGNGHRLKMEELVYLIEHDISPKEYDVDEFGVALSERIYRTRIQVDNTIRREMSYAKCRDETVEAVLRLIGKNRLYLA